MIANAKCPRCGRLNELMACQNCGGTQYRFGPLSDGSQGMICKGCDLGFSHIACQAGCGTSISASAFGTPGSRFARQLKQNMDSYEGGKCFIATELYGADSIQVAILRRFRDRVLLASTMGRTFVACYYRSGPTIVKLIRTAAPLRLLARLFVGALVSVVQRFGTLSCWKAGQGCELGQDPQRSPLGTQYPR